MPEDAGQPSTGKKSIRKSILEFLGNIFVGTLVGVLLVVFVIEKSSVEGVSMDPTLQDHDVILVEKISRYFRAVERGDIVVLDTQRFRQVDIHNDIIKRVIGLPGETVSFSEGKVYINDVLLDETYLSDNIPTLDIGVQPIKLRENEYFCMGDNRSSSLDSRSLGAFSGDDIKGRAVLRIFPIEDFGGIS